ncbi:threonine synthase [Desulfatitalea alkaliphila]|uniref:Threonine synthase n=1 Tax=Desulfatitalea alkaliphila TaxID=2929485 RepID=A0AA41R371_9BACT|nr:threonine synthase [Desulfatitalea alkaliphila]MCJ8502084.1 threonine synthase [Desulfatitalea alkaliphila]
MKPEQFPEALQPDLVPTPSGELFYRCLGCAAEFDIRTLLYTCPECGRVLLIHDRRFDRLKKRSPEHWRRLFDYRRMLTIPALTGIYRYHEFIGPIIPLDAVVYLGEGHTPMVMANAPLQERVGMRFFFKNDGQNPSASFKDRGMASALSYINFLIRSGVLSEVLAVCASTGDTSAAAALYAAYLQPRIKSAVLLPHKKVTPQQLSQPLGSGARVYEIPGVFDDCMKVVEALSEQYDVALLNSKNAWRILGQESYAYEIAQAFEYEMADKVVVVPIGNAGNITAVMSGFLKFHQVGLIDDLPMILGVQSAHADPVYQYYREAETAKRRFVAQSVRPSVAQAAMIGNPVSMPRVIELARHYDETAGRQRVHVVQVTEQAIMDWQLRANRNGHIACTHGGECLAGLAHALAQGVVERQATAVLDATAHALKFVGFQELYFENRFPADYEVQPDPELINAPVYMHPRDLERVPSPGAPLDGQDLERFVQAITSAIAGDLDLKKRS